MEREETGRNGNDLEALLKGLTPSQLLWVSKRIDAKTDTKACEDADIGMSTLGRWKADGVPIDEVVRLIREDSVLLGKERLRRLVPKAIDVLEDELDGRRKLDAAKEVLDRAGVDAPKQVDVSATVRIVKMAWANEST
jgi:hypothetical protein